MKAIVIDDHPVIQQVMAAWVQKFFTDAEIMFAATLAEALDIAKANSPIGLAILDLGLPDSAGVESVLRFRRCVPQARVVIFSCSEESGTIIRAMEAGAVAYIPKSHSPALIAAALRLVSEGGIYVPPQAVRRSNGDRTGSGLDRLTPRQRDVVRLICRGLANKQIADQLGISEDTVKQHARVAYALLGVSSRVQATNVLRRGGFALD